MKSPLEAIELAVTKLYRKRISRRLYAANGNVINYGPFAGMVLEDGSHISDGALALKVFGLYEQELTEYLTSRTGFTTLVNLGAADGYYSIALLRKKIVERSICYEMDEQGREAIAVNARRNGFADAVTIMGTATKDFASEIMGQGVEPENTLVICDIEGAEFEILDDSAIKALARSTFAIEIHNALIENGDSNLQSLLERFTATHTTRIMKSTPPQWQDIPEIEALRDLERAVVTCEGRKMLGEWLIAEPKI